MKYKSKRIFHRWSLLLTAVMCVRALIPIGYMLSLPMAGQNGLALHLCPTQNPYFDVTQISEELVAHELHHHHAGETAQLSEAHASSISSECRSWVNSTAFTVDSAFGLSATRHRAVVLSIPFIDTLTNQLSIHSAHARAPPIIA